MQVIKKKLKGIYDYSKNALARDKMPRSRKLLSEFIAGPPS